MLQKEIFLKQVHGFGHLPQDTLMALCDRARVVALKPKETLFHQGDMAHSFYIIQSGGIRLIQHSESGQDVNLKIYGPGDLFGLLAISGSYPYPSQAVGVMDSRILAIRGEDARYVMQAHPILGLAVVDLLVSHVHHAHDRIRNLAVERVERRLARTVLLYCKKFGRPMPEGTSIDVAVSQQDLGDFVAAKVETINRILKQWERDGIVRLSREHIDVLAPHYLQQLIADTPV